MHKCNIYLNACPTNSKELKNFVMENFASIYGENSWVERSIMLRNSTLLVISNKESIGAKIQWSEKNIIVQLRTKLHQLRCETG